MNKKQGWLECSACEQRILDAEDPGSALLDAAVSEHLAVCRDCTEFCESLRQVRPVLDRYRVAEASEELVEKALGRVLEILPASQALERVPVRTGLFRVLLAGLVSLPLVVLINGLMGWALYVLADSLLPRTVAVYCVGLFALWASMAVSFGYASLPFLGALVTRPGDRLRIVGPWEAEGT